MLPARTEQEQTRIVETPIIIRTPLNLWRSFMFFAGFQKKKRDISTGKTKYDAQ
jgi:hypothetical protein